MNLLTHATNAKLGAEGTAAPAGIYSFSLAPGAPATGEENGTCLGQTLECGRKCYAKKTQKRFPSAGRAWARNAELARRDLPKLERLLGADVESLPTGAVVRIHVAGDFVSVPYVAMWIRLAELRPDVTFYTYSHAWVNANIDAALEWLDARPNVTVWRSTDQASGVPTETPHARRAHIVPKSAGGEIPSGMVLCPEQAGRRANCADCGLCWRAKQGVKLAFLEH